MSHRSKRGQQSVKSASRRRTAEKNCIPVKSCNCSCTVPGGMDGDGNESHKNKMKRLRTRKERNQARGSGEVALNRNSHHQHQHLHHRRNHMCSKDKPQSHSCGQTSSQRKGARVAQRFPSAKEPSVITTNRLIGYHGLFNHEVKSVDIKRLLSGQRKRGRLRQPGLQENNLDAVHPVPNAYLSSPCSSSKATSANSECVLIAMDSDVALHQEKASVDCQSNTHGSEITPGQRPQIPDISSENENLQPTNSPGYSLKHKSKKTKAVMSIMEKEMTSTGGNENVRPDLEKANTQGNPTTPRNQTLALKPSPESPNHLWRNSVSVVAGRLCHSLKLPLRRRRDMLAESRQVLLLALQERHGPLFQENLLGVQRQLSFGNHTVQGTDAVPPTIESDEFFTAVQGKTFDQSGFETHNKASGKSSRKQNHTNWISQPQTNQSLKQDVEGMTSPRVEKVRDVFNEFLRPSSCSPFGLGLEPSASSLPSHYLSSSPVSQWAEVNPPVTQPWDKRFNSTERESDDMGHVEGYLLNQATALQMGSKSLNRETGRHPFTRYLPGQPGGHPANLRHRHGRRSFATSSSAPYSREEDYCQSFYHFNHHPTNPFPKTYNGDMMHYPPSDLLDRGQSPPLTSFNSPEQWSFPPMRLY
ncbi:hypothetical protein N1851_023308 [Merluccius polli]|uniref:Uncharacterized protein n=1 Tax=Merluccius polli TaxID=89951 RepID=A0AA47NWR8_MERPO|nr:hypothetical protein N1851_023308 [Merluccius polli]